MTKPDIGEAEFIIYLGHPAGRRQFPDADDGQVHRPGARQAGRAQYVVVDPLLSRGGVIGDRASWLPVKPGTDGALALAMIRWIIENKRFNADYLSHPTQKAAEEAGELSHTDATHLVIDDPAHPEHGRFLTAKLAGSGGRGRGPRGSTGS